MTLFAKYFKYLLTLSIFSILAGCQAIDVRGQFISDQAIKDINSKKLNREQLVHEIGNPTYIPDYTENTWYYIQRSMSRKAWLDPKVVKQRIVKITFADKNGFARADLVENTHNEKISSNDNYTKTRGTEQTGIQKFVKNIGRFNKTTDKVNKKKKKKK